jgi:hypothetical protein
MASFTANHCFSPYNGTHATTDGFRNGHPIPEEYFFASIPPHHGYTISQDETAFSPPYSIGLRPGLPMPSTGLDSGFIGLVRNINGGFDISESSYYIWPSDNQSIPTDQINCGLGIFNLTPSFMVPDSPPSIFNPRSHLMATGDMWTDAAGSVDINPIGILNDLQMPVSESFSFGRTGWYSPQHFIASK